MMTFGWRRNPWGKLGEEMNNTLKFSKNKVVTKLIAKPSNFHACENETDGCEAREVGILGV